MSSEDKESIERELEGLKALKRPIISILTSYRSNHAAINPNAQGFVRQVILRKNIDEESDKSFAAQNLINFLQDPVSHNLDATDIRRVEKSKTLKKLCNQIMPIAVQEVELRHRLMMIKKEEKKTLGEGPIQNDRLTK